jgi:hypothetical protein
MEEKKDESHNPSIRAKISLGGTSRNHLAKTIRKLDTIQRIKFHLLIHSFI